MKKEKLIQIAWEIESDLRLLQTNIRPLTDSINNYIENNPKDSTMEELLNVLEELQNFDLFDFVTNADAEIQLAKFNRE